MRLLARERPPRAPAGRTVRTALLAALALVPFALAPGSPGEGTAVRAAPAPEADEVRQGLVGRYYTPHLRAGWPDYEGLEFDAYGVPSPAPGKQPDAVRLDRQIAFGLGAGFTGTVGSPFVWWPEEVAGLRPGAVIWTGFLRFPAEGPYYLTAVSEGATAIYVNQSRVALKGHETGGSIASRAFTYPETGASRPINPERAQYLVPIPLDGPRYLPVEVRYHPHHGRPTGIDLYWVTPGGPRGPDGRPVAVPVPPEALFADAPGVLEGATTRGVASALTSDFLYFPSAHSDDYLTLTVRLADRHGRPVPGRRVHVSGLVSYGPADEIVQPERLTDANGVTTARVRAGPGHRVAHESTFHAVDLTDLVDVAPVAHVRFVTTSPTFLPITYAPYYDDRSFLVEPAPLVAGRPARITVPLQNRDRWPAELTVTFLTQAPNIGGARDGWGQIGRVERIRLEPGETREVSVTWTPPASDHLCFKVEVFGRYLTAGAGLSGAPARFAALGQEPNAGGEGVTESLQQNMGSAEPDECDCDEAAGGLRSEYRGLGGQLANPFPPGVSPDRVSQHRQRLLGDYERLRGRWDALRDECAACGIDIGELEGSELPSSPPGDPVRDREEDKRYACGYAGGGRAFARDNRMMGDIYSHAANAAGKWIGGPVWERVGAFGGEVWKQVMEEQAKSWDRWSDAWQESCDDPPRFDFQIVAVPAEVAPVEPPAATGHAGRLAADAGLARARQAAYLGAYVVSYERYQGAEALNHPEGMARQAEAMVELARGAIREARTAGAWAYDFEHLLASELVEALEGSSEALLDDGVPDALRELRNRLATLTPEPPDLEGLEALLRTAEILRRDTGGPAGPRRSTYTVGNPTDRDATVDLHVRPVSIPPGWRLDVVDAPQAGSGGGGVRPLVQEVRAGELYRVRLPPGGEVRVASVVTPAGPVGRNVTVRWAVEGRIGDELIGGMMHELHVPHPSAGEEPTPTVAAPFPGPTGLGPGALLAALAVLLGGALIGLLVFWVLRRRTQP